MTLSVILGLVIGKPLGITGAAFAAVKLRLAALPAISVPAVTLDGEADGVLCSGAEALATVETIDALLTAAQGWKA